MRIPVSPVVSVAGLAAAAVLVAGCNPPTGTAGTPAPHAAGSASSTPTALPHPATKKPATKRGQPHAPADAAGPYTVLRVVDGDTLHVSIDGRDTTLRLIGMDTPEVVDPRKPVQCFGRQASNEGHKLLDGHEVRLTYDPSQGRVDTYGRTLAYVWLPDGRLYEQVMVRGGWAHEYTYDTAYRYQARLRAAETYARTHGNGLWSPSICNGNTTQGVAPTPKRHATHPPGPARTSHAPSSHQTVTPGAFCASSDAGSTGVSAAGHTYVCRKDANGRLRWRRP